MIFGIGCDIVRVSRFEKWVKNPDILKRYFNARELHSDGGEKMSAERLSEYYAVRFAAKEAFSKALGTGLQGFSLTDIYILKEKNGKPRMEVTGEAKDVLERLCGAESGVFVSLSHEKEYAIAYVVIERG